MTPLAIFVDRDLVLNLPSASEFEEVDLFAKVPKGELTIVLSEKKNDKKLDGRA